MGIQRLNQLNSRGPQGISAVTDVCTHAMYHKQPKPLEHVLIIHHYSSTCPNDQMESNHFIPELIATLTLGAE